MRSTRTLFSLLLLPILYGCSSVQIILKPPVESECGSAGLKGCPELTEGVLLYVEGEEAKGKDKLLRGAAENAPAKVRKFAQALKELNKIPGASNYMKQVMKVADILASAKGADDAGPPGATARRGGGSPGASDGVDDDRRLGGVVSPATSRDRAACGALGAFGSCMFVAAGPLVLTDLTTNAGCPAETVVGVLKLSGLLDLPRWAARNPHGMGSERAVVRAGESLFFGVQASGANDARCGLTWAGFRPADGR